MYFLQVHIGEYTGSTRITEFTPGMPTQLTPVASLTALPTGILQQVHPQFSTANPHTTEMARVTLIPLGAVKKEISVESPITFIAVSCLRRIRSSETRSTPAAAPITPSGTAHSEPGSVVDDVTRKTFPSAALWRTRLPWIPVLGRFACIFSRKGHAGPFFGVGGGVTSTYNPPSVLSP